MVPSMAVIKALVFTAIKAVITKGPVIHKLDTAPVSVIVKRQSQTCLTQCRLPTRLPTGLPRTVRWRLSGILSPCLLSCLHFSSTATYAISFFFRHFHHGVLLV